MSITKSLLEKFTETLSYLNSINPQPLINPIILYVCSLIVAVMVAFSKILYSGLLGLLYFVILYLLLHPNTRLMFRYMFFIFLFAFIPGVPIIFSNNITINELENLTIHVSYKGIIVFVEFFLRVFSSSLIVVVVVLYIGWHGLSSIFFKLNLRKFYFFFNIVVISIPKLMRYLLYFLIARESRTIKNDIREKWKMLGSVIGDIIITSSWMGKITGMAISARTIYIPKYVKNEYHLRQTDIFFILLSTFFVLVILLLERGYIA